MRSLSSVVVDMADTLPNCLVLKLKGQSVYISMESEEDVMLWMNSLLKVQTMLHELSAIREDADEKRCRSEAATREQLEHAVSCLTRMEQIISKLSKVGVCVCVVCVCVCVGHSSECSCEHSSRVPDR
jgi:hypothetical protein